MITQETGDCMLKIESSSLFEQTTLYTGLKSVQALSVKVQNIAKGSKFKTELKSHLVELCC